MTAWEAVVAFFASVGVLFFFSLLMVAVYAIVTNKKPDDS